MKKIIQTFMKDFHFSNRIGMREVIKLEVNDIQKGSHDTWYYQGLVLANDMKILLISDPATDKAAASLDLNAGSLMDPSNIPGLAHLCEHVMFMGSSPYQKYLSEHRGSSNAFTTADHTNFYFDIAPEGFRQAVYMFSEIIKCPSFTEADLASEINAVDQEFRKNKTNDHWRFNEVEKLLVHSDSDYAKFSTGNKESLLPNDASRSSLDLFKALKIFYNTWYSANLMTITLLSKDPLSELKDMATKYFIGIKNKNVDKVKWINHPLESRTQIMTRIIPLKDLHWLKLTFPIPDMTEYYKSGPCFYVSYLLNAKHPGSLLATLLDHGWVQDLVAGQRAGASGFAFYVINLDLTMEGLNHIQEIICIVFQYLRLLLQEAFEARIYEECREIAQLKFDVKDLEQAHHCVSNLSECLHLYPIEDAVSAGYVLGEFHPLIIKKLLDHLVPLNVFPTLISKTLEDSTNNTEKWYGTSYSLTNIDKQDINSWETYKNSGPFLLPQPNLFIPKDFKLKARNSEDVDDYPSLIVDNKSVKLWFKQDAYYNLPKAVVYVSLISPYGQMDAKGSAFINFLAWVIRHKMIQNLYTAEMVDYHHNISATKSGILLCVKGFNDKLNLVLEETIRLITELKVTVDLFKNLKDSFIRHLQNFHLEVPYKQAVFYTSLILSHKIWSKDELCSAIQGIDEDAFTTFKMNFLLNLHLEMLIHGNLLKCEAHSIYEIISSKFIYPESLEIHQQTEVLLTPGKHLIFLTSSSHSECGCIQVYYQTGPMNTRDNILLQLLCQIINEPAFYQLRTKEQLCYIVQCEVRRSNAMQGLKLVLQGNKQPHYLLNRLDHFMEYIQNYLEDLKEETFLLHKSALYGRRFEKPKKLSSLSSKWWFEITIHQYQFDRHIIETSLLKFIKKKCILDFYKNYFTENSTTRKMCVCVYPREYHGKNLKDLEPQFQEKYIKNTFIYTTQNGYNIT